ncbi:hypothetical protein Tsubulata_039797 [Turnera subulata]|nr:hypothetical protein Tsubulata_039797 [Turnera subulata]
MAAMKLHGSVLSTSAQRPLVCLYEKELDFEFAPVNMRAGEHKKEPFISLNPFGEVPAFEHGDIKIFESRAITKFIAHEYADKGTPLIYTSGKQLADYLIWVEVEALQFQPVASKLVWELYYKPMMGIPQDPAVIQENEAKFVKVLDVYEKRLAQSKYLAGDNYTLADLHHLPNISPLMGTQVKQLVDARPHVSKWVGEIISRPAWAKVLALQTQS